MHKNFLNVLVHELGHVFGLRHTALGFMAADFPSRQILFGIDASVGLDTLEYDYKFCGKLSETDAAKKDPAKLISKVFGVELDAIENICLLNFMDEPTQFPTQDSADSMRLSFRLKDGSTRYFENMITKEISSEIPILGQFLGQIEGNTLYLPWYLAHFKGPFSGRGIQNAQGKNFFMSIDTPFPGVVTFDFGLEGDWQGFTLMKDSPDVEALYGVHKKMLPTWVEM